MSVAAQSLMDSVTYEDLYHRWEQGNWSAYDIDFSADNEGWDSLSDVQRRSAMWIYSMFFYGEDRVADTLAPYLTAAPTEEQQYFLATQQVDEVRHSVFFHRFFKEVIGVGGETIQQTLSSTLPQLNWGYRGIFDRLDVMADELRRDRSIPKYAQAITLYHLIVEGSLAQPGQHFIEDFFSSEETLPGFSSGIANVSRDEQRHIGFGVKVLSELLGEGNPGWEENRAAVVELLREVLPYGPAVFTPPGMNREYTECYGFSIEDIFAFGLKLIRQRWRTIGYPTEEMPPGVFPFDPELDRGGGRRAPGEADARRHPRPARQQSRDLAGAPAPLVRRHRPLGGSRRGQWLARRLPVAVQRRRSLAPDPRQRLDPGRAGRSPEPEPGPRDELERLDLVHQAGREPDEVLPPAQGPAPRQDPRAGADAQGLPGLTRLSRSAGGRRPRAARPRAGRQARAASPRRRGGR